MCVKIPPEYSVVQVMGYLKGKSSLMIFESFPYLCYKFGNRHFWCIGYFVSTVGVNEATIIKYVREQEERDKITDQYSLVERPVSSFTRAGKTLRQESRQSPLKRAAG